MGEAVGRVCGETIGRWVSGKTCAWAKALAWADGAGSLGQVLRVQAVSVRAIFGPVEVNMGGI